MLKRLFDILVSLVLLLIVAPVLLVIAVAIHAHDRGPIFYRQIRVGRGTRTFGMLKFRSMVVNADRIGGYQTAPGDLRVTQIGAFLRRTSLDELPQLINVLKGEMSLVGPRPDVPEQEALYNPTDWRKRHAVSPGITGLAQVRGRSDMSFEARRVWDLQYVDHPSLLGDLKILAQTAKVAIKGF